MDNKIILLVVFLGIMTGCTVFAWKDINTIYRLPLQYDNLIDTSSNYQVKRGSLTIGGDLTVEGDSNICRISLGACPAGFYGSTGAFKGSYKMCCKKM